MKILISAPYFIPVVVGFVHLFEARQIELVLPDLQDASKSISCLRL